MNKEILYEDISESDLFMYMQYTIYLYTKRTLFFKKHIESISYDKFNYSQKEEDCLYYFISESATSGILFSYIENSRMYVYSIHIIDSSMYCKYYQKGIIHDMISPTSEVVVSTKNIVEDMKFFSSLKEEDVYSII